MKEDILRMIRSLDSPSEKLNILREYIQAMVLRSLHESEAFNNLAFMGGTALRFVFDLPRFSEDLDFSLETEDGYNPRDWMQKVKRDLTYQGFKPAISWNDRSVVHKGWIKVAEILKTAGLSNMPGHNLSVKIEIDCNPPAGAELEKRLINRHAVFLLRYYTLPSLMAGKVHALATRGYFKGRDWYDLVWYRSKRPPIEPDLKLLQNALDQTMGKGEYNAREWKLMLIEKLESVDAGALIKDVEIFLEHPGEAELLTKENIMSILQAD